MSGTAKPGDGGARATQEAVEERIETALANSGVDFWREAEVVDDIYAAIAPLYEADIAALRASNAEMLAALRKALPILTETFRWHRSTQSDAGRTIDAYNAMEAARAAIATATEAAS